MGEQAENVCCAMGGQIARYAVAPTVIKDLSWRYSSARLKLDSYGSKDDINYNQTGIADHSSPEGYCLRCIGDGLGGDEDAQVICCIGDDCENGVNVTNVTASCWECGDGSIDENKWKPEGFVPWEGEVSVFNHSKYKTSGNWKGNLPCDGSPETTTPTTTQHAVSSTLRTAEGSVCWLLLLLTSAALLSGHW